MTRLSSLAFSVLLGGSLFAQQPNITNATFAPLNPTECDLLTVTLFGTLPNNVVLTSFNPVYLDFTWTVEVNCGVTGDETPVFPQALPSFAPQPPGTYTFTFNLFYNGNQTDTYTTTITVGAGQTPDPGEYAEHDICTAGPPIALFSQLGGTPDPGGIWYNPNNVAVANGMFVPGVSMEGLYTYLFDYIDGVPCQDALQQVYMHYLPNGNPGVGTTIPVCNGAAPPINLFSLLTGSPQTDGVWSPTLPGGYLGTFTPGTNAPGTYTYTVPGTGGCPDPHSTMVLQGTAAPNAGNGSTSIVCETDTAINLNSLITGEANTGAWYESGGFLIGPFGHHISALQYPEGTYYYVVTSMVCPNDTATLILDYQLAPCFEGIGESAGNVARFDLLPNPASDQLVLEVELLNAAGPLTLDIFDVNGRSVRNERLAVNGSLSRTTLDVSALLKGAYLLRITTPEGSATRRLMVR
jgi:hypothetical protein